MSLLKKKLSALLTRKIRLLNFLEEKKMRYESAGRNTLQLNQEINTLKSEVAKLKVIQQNGNNRKVAVENCPA